MATRLALMLVVAGLGLTACSNDEIGHTGVDEDTKTPTVPSFNALDTNADGHISRQEAQAVPALAKIFDTADNNQDGVLSLYEYSRATIEGVTVSKEAAFSPMLEDLDKNHDGYVSKEEAQTLPPLEKNFSHFDANGDGRLSQKEYADAREDNFGTKED
jgi:Ca2+-binding EF-hand superfamily protein